MGALLQDVASIHPSIWLGSQLGRAAGRTIDTGYPALSAELPGGGWPVGTLTELLVQQPGVGELRLVRPALVSVSKRPIVLLQPPHVPNSLGFSYLGIPHDKLMLLRAAKTADALWSAEQVLRTGTCGALLIWQQHVRAESLRRLLLASQSSDALFFFVRPLAQAQDASPAALRLSVRPAKDAVAVGIIKRKGPVRKDQIEVGIAPSPILLSPHRRVSRPEVVAGIASAERSNAHA
jgi:protein ImuA